MIGISVALGRELARGYLDDVLVNPVCGLNREEQRHLERYVDGRNGISAWLLAHGEELRVFVRGITQLLHAHLVTQDMFLISMAMLTTIPFGAQRTKAFLSIQ